MSWKKVKLSELLRQLKIIVQIDNNKEYKLVTVSSKGTIRQREIVKGLEIKGEKAFEAKRGKFIYSRLSVHNGAFGIVPPELDGALLTSEMPIFEISDKILPEFLIYSLQLPTFKFQLEQLTKGVGRTRVKEAHFLSLIIDLPNISDQENITKSIIKAEQHSELISTELTRQLTLVKKLRQQLLQDAVQGKLVEQNKKDEPASELLKKIKAKKEKLIAEKKLKKEKDLLPIKPEEIPFQIPENWVWCMLGEICTKVTDGFHNTPPKVSEGIPYIAATQVKSDKIDWENCNYVEEKYHRELFVKAYPQKGELLVVNIGAGCGTPAIIDVEFEFSFKNTAILKFNQNLISNKLLFYYFLLRKDEIYAELTKGGLQPFLSLKILNEIDFPLPPIEEQIRIVQKVDELMQYCNELEASIKQSEAQNEKLLQQVLREALRKEPVEV